MSDLILSAPDESRRSDNAMRFISGFCDIDGHPKYIFGRNVYAEKIIQQVEVNGFIDDFTDDRAFLGKPVIRSDDIPDNSMILVSSGGRPLSAMQKISDMGFDCLDYFAFCKHSDLVLTEVVFNEGFQEEFETNEKKYNWIYALLSDDESREVFRKLVSFRYKYDLDLLRGFSSRENEQYFEMFLDLRPSGESFVDVGCYDGFTTHEFIRYCPEYKSIHIFEPDPENYQKCKSSLSAYKNIHFYEMGLANKKQALRFDTQGSGSAVNASGALSIDVDRLDDLINEPITFIKMDIEGSELSAIEGAKRIIMQDHPRLAISVYHKAGDFWRIPEYILSIRNDYNIYMRHYTESIYETVMFFIPA